jgi:hypothetical protein
MSTLACDSAGSTDAGARRSWSQGIRRLHRVLSIAFTLAVVANLVAMGHEQIALWVGMLTLLPLALLLFTGLYLFALPHMTRWRRVRHLE